MTPVAGEDPTETPSNSLGNRVETLVLMGRSTPLMLKRRSADEWLHDHLHYMVPVGVGVNHRLEGHGWG